LSHAKTIGLIGGLSWESTVPYYRTVNRVVGERLAGLHSARIALYSVDFYDLEVLRRPGLQARRGTRPMADANPALTNFRTPAAFRAWLKQHHAKATELHLRCFKVHAAKQGVTYRQALDEALCFGWIDGVRRSVDADSFSTRFTPRKPASIWSRVNIAHVERLTNAGRMAKPGLGAYALRTEARTGVYSFERESDLAPVQAEAFRANKAAWAHYQAQPPWYRRTSAHWVMSAKRAETREKRLAQLIDCSARSEPIPPLDRRRPSVRSPASRASDGNDPPRSARSKTSVV
jgi:uncharacterized protein YdeI (YjbR/CyaY-like superfamily)